MKIHAVMTPNVEVIRPETALHQAAAKMKDIEVGVLPVCDDGRVVGMLTDRDITVRATADGCDPDITTAASVMSTEVISCYEDQDVVDALRLMEENQVRRLLVLDRNERLVGIVSLGDLAVEVRDDQLTGEALERISEPSAPRR